MSQAPRHSLLESIANTATGFVVSNIAWPAVEHFILRRAWHPMQGLAVILVFTVLSVARNYLLRRFFNRKHSGA